jgi:hypothetical protein
MLRAQPFRVLFHEFLFRVAERESLSKSSQGDANRLLGQFATILLVVSMPFTVAASGAGTTLASRDGVEQALVATTMLITAVFSVLNWEGTFPERHDILILAPLPVRISTVFFAKIAAVTSALGLMVGLFNAAPGLILPLTLVPKNETPLRLAFSFDFYRPLAAHWIAVAAASLFIASAVLALQGLAAQLPRAWFTRLSGTLQIAVLLLSVGGYFLQPVIAIRGQAAAWMPPFWFVGLFEELNSTISVPDGKQLHVFAMRACGALAITVGGALAASLLCYWRVMRKTIEQPDAVTGPKRMCLPSFGGAIATAVTQFAFRTALRSRRHRMLLCFYFACGLALAVLFLSAPLLRALSGAAASGVWTEIAPPLLAAGFAVMCCSILGVRLVSSVPVDLAANWIFQSTRVRPPGEYLQAIRHSVYVLGTAPVCVAAAIWFLLVWPCHVALEHIVVLLLVAISVTEYVLCGFQRIPFTCSYCPGKANVHIKALLGIALGLHAIYWGAEYEARVLLASDSRHYLRLVAGLSLLAGLAAWRTSRRNEDQCEIQFEDNLPPVVTELGLS